MNAFAAENISTVLEDWLTGLLVMALAVGVGLVVHWFLFALLARLAARTKSGVDSSVVRHARQPARLILIIVCLFLVLPGLGIAEDIKVSGQRTLTIVFTASIGWLAFNLTRVINDAVAERYDLSVADNLRAREVHTRLRILQRVLAAAILVVTLCLMLMAIPGIRQIGVTLFASAGIAGIVIGLAARPALSNLIAGLQLALTQPIRIDDVVIVEGEWGWIEEIGMTFVVVRVWDLRRLVVPLSYFIETPFQNWTRKTADILGTVYIYTDYTVPTERLREQLHRILKTSDLWDGEVWGLLVTNATEHGLELRALMGAHDSGSAWNLRCHVREKLIEFLQKEYPECLPRVRAELMGSDAPHPDADAAAAKTRKTPS